MEFPLKVIKNLQASNVHFLVIGGIAAVAYGVARSTYDIDILIPPDPPQIDFILKTLSKMGYKDVLKTERNASEKKVKISSISKVSSDFLLQINSFTLKNGFDVDIHIAPTIQFFDFIWKYKIDLQFKNILIPLPSLIDLIHLKESMGREKDLEDSKQLRYILEKRKSKIKRIFQE